MLVLGSTSHPQIDVLEGEEGLLLGLFLSFFRAVLSVESKARSGWCFLVAGYVLFGDTHTRESRTFSTDAGVDKRQSTSDMILGIVFTIR